MSERQDFRQKCQTLYLQWSHECEDRVGLTEPEVCRSRDELSESKDGRWYLRPEAFAPSGVALGCPLPDATVTRRLWRFAQLIDKRLKILTGSDSCFAYVPPHCYHITILNRDHFAPRGIDHRDSKQEGPRKIKMLSKAEFHRCRGAVTPLSVKSLSVLIRGLVLPANGRVLVTAYPVDNHIPDLRLEMLRAVPDLGKVNIPGALTIKLGHIRHSLVSPQLQELLAWLRIRGEHLPAKLDFTELYTPRGCIQL